VAQLLIREARQLYANQEMGAELDQTVYALDTPGRVSDVGALDRLALEAGSFYVMDPGYIHFASLYRFVLAAAPEPHSF
jgi:hypothetical protein